jgi:hypothetical protein
MRDFSFFATGSILALRPTQPPNQSVPGDLLQRVEGL